MLSVKDAFDKIVGAAAPLPAVPEKLADLCRSVLAEPIRARRTQPAADLSAMDGFAVRSVDLSDGHKPVSFSVKGVSAAGVPWEGDCAPRSAVRIFTGAVLPAGYDQVIIQENTQYTDLVMTTHVPARPGDNIRLKGADFQAGQAVLNQGDFITPQKIGLIAASGFGQAIVHRRPIVQIITTGEELVAPEESSFKEHQTVDSAGPMLAALCQSSGAVLLPLLRTVDEACSIQAAVETGLEQADITITIGGASVGARDYVMSSASKAGVSLDFWKINMRPGKPLMYGRASGHGGDKHFIGLPGNMVSAFVCSILFVRPLIDKLAGRPAPMPEGVLVPVAQDLAANSGRTHFMRASLVGQAGQRCVEPASNQDSSLARLLAASDGLIIREENAPAVKAGSLVPYLPF